MRLAPNTRIGAYEIAVQIGAGGMGEVYRAHDSRLNRDVALKVLPESFIHDADRLARFQREARVLASLNHPNIAAIYGVEEAGATTALVIELVEGPTLADRIATGPIPFDEALPIALQITEALEAAHEQGIIHRDLKPANIKLKADGTVKVLDFGLAKAMEPENLANPQGDGVSNPILSHSPTITSPGMTQVGMLLGTAAYMSPEQAKGRPADKRSDVWAFGCVLFEMLTGERAFADADVSETLAAVLKSEPDWTRIPADVPQPIRKLIQTCLVKDRRRRVADIAVAKFVLRDLSSIDEHAHRTSHPIAPPRSLWRRRLPVIEAIVLSGLIVGASAWAFRPRPEPAVVVQFSFAIPEAQALSGTRQAVAISPDGTRIVYSANQRLYLRSIGEVESRPIAGTENATVFGLMNPIFAPDGESVAYFSQGEGSALAQTNFVLKRIPISGGTPSTLATFDNLLGASWYREGIFVGQSGGIVRVSPDGGGSEFVVRTAPNERAYGPHLLPGGKSLLFTLVSLDELVARGWDNGRVIAYTLSDGKRTPLIDGASDARYSPSGHLVYAVAGSVFAAPFDARTLTVGRAGVPVIAGVRRATGRAAAARDFAFSESGTLAYLPGPATTPVTTSVVLADGAGELSALKIPIGDYSHPRVSPTGTMVAVVRANGQEADVWTYDLSGKTAIRRLTFGGNNRFPVWSGDGQRVAFQSTREGDRGIYWQAADGTGGIEGLTRAPADEEHRPEAFSRDGRYLLFSTVKDGNFSLSVLTMATRKADPFGGVQSREPLSASFSSDGRWIVYASSPIAGGVLSADRGVFIQPFPATGEMHQAPKRFLDFHPVWAPNGAGIFYVPGATRATVFVPVTTRPSVTFGTPVELPRGPFPGVLSSALRGYDFLPDGKRFVSLAGSFGDESESRHEMRVVLNWFQEVKRLAPTK